MKAVKRVQIGFSTPFMFIIVVLVIIGIATAGVMVYDSNKDTKLPVSSSTTKSPQTIKKQTTSTADQSQQTASPTTLDITEWGVHLTLDSNTSSLYYYINPQNPDVAYLSLKTVSNVAPLCAADQISLGAIERLTDVEQQAITNGTTYGRAGTIQIGDYWYGFGTPQASCEADAATQQAVAKAQPAYSLQSVFNTLTAD